MRRGSPQVVLVAAALGLVAWLALGTGRPEALPAGADRAPEVAPGATLSVPGDPPTATSIPILGGRAAPAPTPEPHPTEGRGDVLVTVQSQWGYPIPFCDVMVEERGRVLRHVAADAAGTIALPDSPLDGSLSVRVSGYADASVPVRSRFPIVVARAAVPLELDCRDAETGKRVPGVRWRYDAGSYYVSPWVEADGGALPLQIEPRATLALQVQVEAPPGWVAHDDGRYLVEPWSFARRLRIVHPLRREARIAIDVSRSEDGSAVQPVAIGFQLDGGDIQPTWAEPGRGGWMTVPRIPFFRELPLRIILGDRAFERTYPLSPRRPASGRALDRIEGTTAIDVRHHVEPDGLLEERRVLPPVATRMSIPAFPAPSLPSGRIQKGPEVRRLEPEASGDRGDLMIRVFDHSGRPLPRALIVGSVDRHVKFCLPADGDGVLRVRALRAGLRYAIATVEPGVLTARAEVDLAAGAAPEVTLREPEGATLRVRVVDEAGRGIPFASFASAYGASWDFREGDVQVINDFTDAAGSAVLSHLAPGRRGIHASRFKTDGRSVARTAASEPLDLRDGETRDVTLVLPDPK